MAKSQHVLSVFVASPSDVKQERNLLESIINELNKTWSKTLNLRLELLRWETDCYPAFGDYSQGVINDQIGDEYDIFIGLFWGRFGTPTIAAESGTKEEFDRAYARYKANPESIDIMLYFKDHPIAPSALDPEQLAQIANLKRELGEKSGLYWPFEHERDFEPLIRAHLSKVAQKWSHKLTSLQVVNTEPVKKTELDESELFEEEELGIFEYVELYEERISDLISIMDGIADSTEKVGTQIGKRTQELKAANGESRAIKRNFKLAAEDLQRYSRSLDSQVPLYKSSREDAFDALAGTLKITLEDMRDPSYNEELDDIRAAVAGLRNATQQSYTQTAEFKDTVMSLPRFTTGLTKARRLVASSLDSMLEELRQTVRSSEVVINTIEEHLAE
ncbi:hypothetical protein [Vibrio parahaemolyticus]|uniref:hypothetical protein n=2 Tax=Vibrio parahaemolyticus TaxID=670 RepID=UPI00370DED38|nr:hypothetical protein [Vibrio parahaemolyticus]